MQLDYRVLSVYYTRSKKFVKFLNQHNLIQIFLCIIIMLADDNIREVLLSEAVVQSPVRGGLNSTQALCYGTQVQIGSWTIAEPALIPTCKITACRG